MGVSMSTVQTQHLGNGNADGTIVGGPSASDKVSLFFGITPVVLPAATAQSTVPSTVITTVSSTSITTLDLTKINAAIARIEEIRVLVDAMRTAMVAVGVMKGSI